MGMVYLQLQLVAEYVIPRQMEHHGFEIQRVLEVLAYTALHMATEKLLLFPIMGIRLHP